MFVNSYFHRFLGRNPFGHAALDMKAFFMGLTGVKWSETALQQAVLLVSLIVDATIIAEDLAGSFASTPHVLVGNPAFLRAIRVPISSHHRHNGDTDRR
jgi:hypothetical protein